MDSEIPRQKWHPYFILGGEDGKTLIPCNSAAELAQWSTEENTQIGLDVIQRCRISTVFFGINAQPDSGKPPIVFETLVWDEKEDSEVLCWRHETWAEANRFHDLIVHHYRETESGMNTVCHDRHAEENNAN